MQPLRRAGVLSPVPVMPELLGDAIWFFNHPLVVGGIVAGIVTFLVFIAWQEKR